MTDPSATATTDTFTNAKGERFIAGQRVEDATWQRFHEVLVELEHLRSVVRLTHETLNLQFHTVTWNRLSAPQLAAVDRALDNGREEA